MDLIRQPDAKLEFYPVHQELKSRLDTSHQMKLLTLATGSRKRLKSKFKYFTP